MSFKLKFQYPKLVSFINDDNSYDAVYNNLLGTAYTNENLAVLENYNILLRKDHRSMKGKVKLLAGGGAGIEPAETGCVGPGMLTAAVFGDLFVAPSSHTILVAIRELAHEHPDGVLLLVKNYFGDKLNFGLALQQAVSEKMAVKMLLIGDDSVNSEPRKSGRRGLAGSILVYKIAGAMADAGKSLGDIFNACRERVLTDITSVSVCLAPSRSLKWINSAPGDTQEVIIGIGAYGQPGVKTKYYSLSKTIGTMLNIVTNIILKRKLHGPLIVLLNNLGATSKLEESVICTEVTSELLRRGFAIARFFSGTFMPLLDSKGFSITLLKVIDPDTLMYIDAPASTSNWPNYVFTSIDKSIEDSSEEETEEPIEEQNGKPIEKQMEESTEEPTEDITEELTAEQTDPHTEKPNEQPPEGQIDKPTKKQTDESDIKEKIKAEIKSEMKTEIEDMKTEIKKEVKEDLKTEIKNEVKKDIKTEIKQEVKEYTKAEIKREVKEKTKANKPSGKKTSKSKGNPLDKYVATTDLRAFVDSAIMKPTLNHTEIDELAEKNKPLGPTLPPCTKAVKQILTFVAEALISCEKQLNSIDMEAGDGDAGTMLKNGAVALKKALESGKIDLKHPYKLFQDLAKIADRNIGGATGALYYCFFNSASQSFLHATDTSLKVWCEAFKAGVNALNYYGGAKIGERTLLDPLQPAVDVFEEGLNNNEDVRRIASNIACTCEFYAERTKHFKPFYVRGNYASNLMYPDPGAHAVSVWMRAINEGIKLNFPE